MYTWLLGYWVLKPIQNPITYVVLGYWVIGFQACPECNNLLAGDLPWTPSAAGGSCQAELGEAPSKKTPCLVAWLV